MSAGVETAALNVLQGRVADAIARAAERPGRTLASATVEVDPFDVCAAIFASRLASDSWFCWEQPDGELALAAMGSAAEIVSRGDSRFAEVAADCSALLRDAELEEGAGLPAGAGPVFTGGFAFDPDGGREPQWSSLPPALMVLPELSLLRNAEGCWLTATVVVGEGEAHDALARLERRLSMLHPGSLGPVDPAPGYELGAPRTPGDYERVVAAAVERITGGELDKVVLAREVVVTADAAHEPGTIFGALREVFPTCFCFCAGTPDATFIGASPELLVRRRGAVAATVALAGTTRRSADPAVDDHLGEQMLRSDKVREEHAIVAKRIARTLRGHSVWVEAEPEPGVVKIANVQHLATPIHAQLADSRSAVELAGILHPTPAVGGEPRERAVELIAELEGMDRGWYTGPVGWMDAAEDGEFCVGLRSALLRDRTAHLFAGCGIVAGSEPAAELDESELKLAALLPLLTG